MERIETRYVEIDGRTVKVRVKVGRVSGFGHPLRDIVASAEWADNGVDLTSEERKRLRI